MLVGENGCGKTAIINERIRTVCSGEVAEVLSLTLYANRFTNARLLFDRIDERLEWKHGRTFVPKGNKRLLCLVDDVNLSQTDAFGHQTACELIREHLDDGGFYSPANHMWRYVKSVTYVTSVNPQTTANVPPMSQRLLRHFAVFGCPYPSTDELKTIYSTLLNTHFFTPENASSSSSAAQQFGLHDDRSQGGNVRFLEESLRTVMTSMVKVTVELSERMRSMFLPTAQRCHYFFTTRDLSTIFRNICLSLRPGCNKRNLLLLWQHEAFWVYGKRMVNEVDFRRFRQAFVTAVRKQFIDDDQIQTIIRPRSPLFTNLMEQDSGIVTAGMINARVNQNVSDEDAKTDLYRPAKSFAAVKELLERGVEEYNKIHPRIKMALYKTVIEQVCRLARTMASPHEGANSVLVAEGCPARCSVIVRLAANLCGYTIHQVTSTNPSLPAQARMDQFKADLVSGYTRAGAKGEHILLLLREEELAERDYLVYLTEFIISGAITHLFTYEEQTTIINSIRTEVTQAGLTYTRDVAWNFFLRTVRNNFRVMLVMCGGGNQFHAMCRDYPTLAKNVNFIWFPHWSKTQLIEHALFHVKEEMPWLSEMQQENVSHMLASMHLVLRQQDGGEQTCGEYCHVNNTGYQKFVERFISLANAKDTEVNRTHETVKKTLQQIRHENEVAIRLKKQLEHEMVVLQERKAGTIKILSQIGQDTAITEQQIRVVKNQLEKITHLKKRLPEYQVAHERAVYKAIAIVADTKKVVKLMDVDDLAELRGMQKPSLEIEDLMAAIIMLLKSPSADLTWQKGAKRQMANLERFVEELTTFDDFQLPEATLVLVEPFLKKPTFEPEAMAEKTGNSACGALCKWVRGVVRYHRMMISKVKPLHQKVEETTLAVDSAQHKMNTLENKRKALEIRLADLARGFEEATIDKNEQEEKTVKMKKMLDTAAQLRRILRGERQRCQQIFDSHERRLVAIPGGCAMAAAFATYLGAYHHNFRRVMLTVHWPGCLRERGIPLVIDSVDGLRGRVIDWSIAFLKTASGASSVYEVDYATLVQNMGGSSSKTRNSISGEEDDMIKDKADDEEKEKDEAEKSKSEKDGEEEEGEDEEVTGEVTAEGETTVSGDVTKETATKEDGMREDADQSGEEEKADEEKREGGGKTPTRSAKSKTPPQATTTSEPGAKTPEGSTKPKTPTSQPGTPGKNKSNRNTPTKENEPEAAAVDQVSTGDGEEEGLTVPRLSKIQEEDGDMDDDLRSEMSTSTAPVLTSSQYNKYVRSLIKLLVGEPRLNEWIMKDFGPRQIENVSILCTSWQRPPLMVDPNGEGALWLGRLNSLINKRKLISLDMENRSDPHIMSSLEKAITKGKPVLMTNCGDKIDNMIAPLVHHRNTAHENDKEEEPRMILFCGRRTLCHPDFRFYLSSGEQKPQLNAITASSVSLINFGVSHDTLTEDLLTRVFARVRPELFKERSKALRNLQRQKDTLYRFSETVKDQVLSGGQEAMLSSPKALQFITNITDAKLQLAHQLADTQTILDDLDLLKDELYPVARRGSLLYSLMRSLAAIYPELRFTMEYFLHLFDEAVGGSLPEEYMGTGQEDEGADTDDAADEADGRGRVGSVTSQTQQEEGGNAEGGEEEKPKEEEAKEEEAGGTVEGEGEEKLAVAPTETEESVSTGAVHKLVHGSDSDDLPTIEMPEVTPLPSAGVEYTSYTSAKVKVLMDSLTSLVYHRIKMCLFEEDRLLFSTLMCLNMKVEAGEDITNEEMSLFLQGNPGLGMQLSLQDFDCRDAETPTWLPTEKWEDILALSVLPGPLDSLCVDFAANSEAWREWYHSPYPEKLPLPSGGGGAAGGGGKKKEEDDGGEKVDEGTEKEEKEGGRGSAGPQTPEEEVGRLNDFHRLLLLRMLRQDRLPTALLTYTQRHLALYDPEEEVFNVNEILKEARKHLGVLVLLPPVPSDPRGHPAMRLKLTRSPVDELILLAKAVGIPIERAVVSDGSFVSVEEALDSADKHEGWAIIEGIHLTTPPLLAKLTGHLERIHKSRVNFKEEQGEESKFCVFLTSGTNSALPASLVQNLLKVAWNSVLSYPDLSAKTDSQREEGAADKKLSEIFNPLSPRSYLKTAIVSAVRLIPEWALEKLQDSNCPQLSRALVFAVAVLHGLLTSRQLMGSVGLARWHPFGASQVSAAAQAILSPMLLTKDETEPPLEDLLLTISELVYGAMVAEDTDRKYIEALCERVIGSVYREPQSEILLGGTLIPVPPATIDPTEYAEWFEQTADDKMTLKTLQLNTTVERCTNEASATNFVARLDRMFETQNMEAGDVAIPPPSATASLLASPGGNSPLSGAAGTPGSGIPSSLPTISIDKLRSALDICLEHLPLLLDLGEDAAQLLMRTDYDFPYHCPSIISMSSAESALMPESIGYVLLQECLWMNTVLCHIRQEIADLQGHLVGGAGALPVRLLPIVLSVQEEYVPTSWIHPNCQPCTHSLVTWLADLNKRHVQLNRWVRRGMVPTFNLKNNRLDHSQPSTIARGQLTNVWLGGLVNPGALLTALRQERAILARADLDDVEFHAVVMHDASQADFDMDEGGIFVSDLILENAAWNYKENGLVEAKGAGITSLKCVYLKPVVRARKVTPKAILQEDVDEEEEEQSGEKTFSTKNATIGEDAQSVTPQQTGEANKDPSSTGNEGGEPAATAAPVEDNKTQEEEGKEKVAEEGQATRPKSKNSQKSLKQEAAERKSVGGGSKAGEKVEKEEDAERAEEGEEGALPPGMVEVPIYMNKSRQIQVWSLPMRTSSPDVNWTLCRVALVLDEGLPEGGCKKSRAYLMLQRLQPMMRPSQPEDDDEEGQEEEDGAGMEDDVDDVDEEEEVNVEGDSGAESTRSQLSYKPMSPKAPPLPEGLGLKRENPLAEGKEGGEGEARPLSRMSAQSRGREEGGNGVKEKKNEEGGVAQGDQTDGKVVDAGEKAEGEGKGQSQAPARGDEPDAERLDRQREGDRGGEEVAVATDGQASSAPAGQQDEASKSGAGAEEGSQAQEAIPHPGSRQASRGSKRNVDGANPTSQDGSGEGGGQRATEDSKTNTVAESASRVKSGTRKASGKGNGGRGGEEEAPARKPVTPAAQKPGSKPVSRESQKKMPLETKVTDPQTTAANEEQPTEADKAHEQEAVNTENLSGDQEGSGGRGTEEDPPKTEGENATGGGEVSAVERSDDAGHMTLDFKPAGTPAAASKDKPASREKPPTREKPASREKVLSREKPASREKLASRGKVASREKPASRGSQSKVPPPSTTTRGTENAAGEGDTA